MLSIMSLKSVYNKNNCNNANIGRTSKNKEIKTSNGNLQSVNKLNYSKKRSKMKFGRQSNIGMLRNSNILKRYKIRNQGFIITKNRIGRQSQYL
jgi:hypothetical protein